MSLKVQFFRDMLKEIKQTYLWNSDAKRWETAEFSTEETMDANHEVVVLKNLQRGVEYEVCIVADKIAGGLIVLAGKDLLTGGNCKQIFPS